MCISAADPLNLAGTVLPGARVSAPDDSASNSRRNSLVRGVCSEGLRYTWLPAAIAETNGTSARFTG